MLVNDAGAALLAGLGVDELAVREVLVVLLLVAVAQGTLELYRQLAAPLGEGLGILFDRFDRGLDLGEDCGIALLDEQAAAVLGVAGAVDLLGFPEVGVRQAAGDDDFVCVHRLFLRGLEAL